MRAGEALDPRVRLHRLTRRRVLTGLRRPVDFTVNRVSGVAARQFQCVRM
jgi:hypothetical protein